VAARVARANLPQEEIDVMERELVASSTIVSAGYDAGSETLEVEFKSGGTYQYFNVPAPVYQQFMESGSKGQFLHANIKSSFPYSKV
jgi:hypothetical protein